LQRYSPPQDPQVPAAGPVYRFAAAVAFRTMDVQRWQFDVRGFGNLPRRQGAVLAANHIGFWDFFTVGRAAYYDLGRPVRILAKDSLFEAPVFGRLMKAAGHIPVHRAEGAHALRSAVAALRSGELVLVLPEQTISPSFELLPFKTGAARMAAEAGVPIVPAASWGSHRFHTVLHRPRWHWRLPVSIAYGEPLRPGPQDDPAEVTDQLRDRIAALVDELVATYPDGAPAGAWWVPKRFGGGAPSPAEGNAYVERIRRDRFGRRSA
jgi:1-acyl-sn-glycerol-3-phosphate acyltransferase